MPNETVNIYRDTFDGARTDFRMVAVRDHITQFQRGNVDFPSEDTKTRAWPNTSKHQVHDEGSSPELVQ